MKRPEPWYRARKDRPNGGAWYVQIGDQQHKLIRGPKDETEDEAWRIYFRLMAAEGRDIAPADLMVALAVDLYLDYAKKRVAKDTFEQYKIKLQNFVGRYGRMKVMDLRPRHVEEWIRGNKWSDSTKRGAITSIKLCLAWCVHESRIPSNPIAAVKRPKMRRRERTIAPAERSRILAEVSQEFRDYLDAMTWTGARPGEIMRLEARHIDFDAAFASLEGKTTAATGELITFPLVPPMLALCRQLAERHPTGPLFRNSRGKPWTPNAVRCRMRLLRARLNDAERMKKEKKEPIDLSGVTAYSYRHSYATDAIERGVSAPDLAALMNHKDIRTTMNYVHIKERKEHLRKQAERAVNSGAEASHASGKGPKVPPPSSEPS